MITALAALLLAVPTPTALPRAATSTAAEGKVVVLGIDGADARTIGEMIERDELPNLKRLAEQGTFAPLGTTLSAESPVAWASLNTGQNPGKTGIAGFIERTVAPNNAGVPMVTPAIGHQRDEGLERDEFELGGVLALLGAGDAKLVTIVAGALSALFFFLVFAGLLRLRPAISGVLALGLGAVGAYGANAGTRYLPDEVPAEVRKGNPLDDDVPNLWEAAGRGGKRCVVLDAAMAWDRPKIDGVEVLAGLGMPDSRGQNGMWFIYTDEPTEVDAPPAGRTQRTTAGTVFKIKLRDDRLETKVYGVSNFWRTQRIEAELAATKERLSRPEIGWKEGNVLRDRETDLYAALDEDGGRTSLPMTVERTADGKAKVRIGESEQTLAEGEWSDYYRLDFELNPLLRSRAITRIKILSMREPFRMFVNSLDIDPEHPQFWQPVSQPREFSRKLARSIGKPFETFGWACVTMAYKDELISVDTLLEDVEFTLGWREALLDSQLESKEAWDLLFAVFSTPDRIQHMTYHFYDPEHPLYDAAAASRKVRFFGEEVTLSQAIPAIYRQIDRIVGKVVAKLGPQDTLLLCADHGFQSFRRQVHLNNWLYERGYLVLKPEATRNGAAQLSYVDWTRTKAYALGLGAIYLNLADREPDGIVQGWQEGAGIVEGSEAALLLQQLERDFLDTVDPATGLHAFSAVYVPQTIEPGPHRMAQADLMPGHAATYRVSWRTTLGDISWPKDSDGPGPVFEDNDKTWSGGHVSVDPELVRGAFFSSRPLAEVPANGGVHLTHIAPTVLSLLGVAPPAASDRAPLRFR